MRIDTTCPGEEPSNSTGLYRRGVRRTLQAWSRRKLDDDSPTIA